MKKKELLLVGLQARNQGSLLGQSNSLVTSHLCPKDKRQDLVLFLQETPFSMKSFVEKTKLLILGFKIRHLSLFFKEQKKEKPLKHTTYVPKAGPLHSQCLRKNQSRQHQKLVTPCSALPPNLDWETHDGNVDTSRQTEGARARRSSGREPELPGATWTALAVSTTGKETKTLTSSAAESL